MVLRKLLLIGALLIIEAGSAYGLSLTARVDKTEATLADQIFLTLAVEGSQRSAKPHGKGSLLAPLRIVASLRFWKPAFFGRSHGT